MPAICAACSTRLIWSWLLAQRAGTAEGRSNRPLTLLQLRRPNLPNYRSRMNPPPESSLPPIRPASQDTLNLRYLGEMNDVEVHYDGRLVIHSIRGDNGAVRYLVSLFGGPCVLNAQRAQDVFVANGRCVVQAGDPQQTSDYKADDHFSLPASSQCWVNAVEGFCQLLLTPVGDPGFGGRDREQPILR